MVRHFEAERHGASSLRAEQRMAVFTGGWVYLKSWGVQKYLIRRLKCGDDSSLSERHEALAGALQLGEGEFCWH
jgi:hypothetical protein